MIKYNELSLIKKSIKTKELKTETTNDPLTTHIRTQTITYEHWSRRPIRRSVPTGDDRQAPEQRRHNKGESQRQSRIHAQTQGHTEQTAERCHRGTTTNRCTTHSDASNRIHPVQGRVSPFPAFHSCPLFSFISESCRQGLMYTRYRYKNLTQENNPHLFSITSRPHWAYPFTTYRPRFFSDPWEVQNSLATNEAV